jgi:DNA-binding transcriptional LysR family regulator
MAEPVRAAMASLHNALREPAAGVAAARPVHVVANAYARAIVLPRLVAQLPGAPGAISLKVSDPSTAGSPDVALTIDWAGPFPSIGDRHAVVLRDSLVCVSRRHAVNRASASALDEFLQASHAVVGNDRGGDPVDRALALHEKHRRIAIQVPDFVAAASIAASTDLVAVVPKRLVAWFGVGLDLRVTKMPLVLKDLSLVVSWPRQAGGDPLAMWVKNRLLEAGRDGRAGRKS